MNITMCANCNNSLLHKDKRRTFCSFVCYTKSLNSKKEKNCLECNNLFLPKRTNSKFCSNSCSAKNSNKKRTYKPKEDLRTKTAICVNCFNKFNVNIRRSIKNIKCSSCKIQNKNSKLEKTFKVKTCKYCGQNHNSNFPKSEACKKNKLFPSLAKYFGLDLSKVGSSLIYEEYNRIKNLIIEDYYELGLSLPDMCKKYKHNNVMNFSKILNSLEINRRSLSEANKNALMQGKHNLPKQSFLSVYKNGWHTTWNNKKVFYRSSYELDQMKIFDNLKTDYEVEKLRILYWDTQSLKQRIAIPDFYIQTENLIIEIKSEFTLNKQNMIDKVKSYTEHGYKFKLILNHKEIDLNTI